MLPSVWAREVPVCSRKWLMQKLITKQSLSNKWLLKDILKFVYVSILQTCMYTRYMPGAHRVSEEVCWIPETGVMGGCGPQYWCLGLKLGPMWKQQVFITAEPSLQSYIWLLDSRTKEASRNKELEWRARGWERALLIAIFWTWLAVTSMNSDQWGLIRITLITCVN